MVLVNTFNANQEVAGRCL